MKATSAPGESKGCVAEARVVKQSFLAFLSARACLHRDCTVAFP